MKKTTTILATVASICLAGLTGCSTVEIPAAAPPLSQATPAAPAPGTVAAPSTPAVLDTVALQGTWTGRELSADSDAPVHLIVTGKNFEFHGADTNEWYKGTFTLRDDSEPKVMIAMITECPAEKYVGKTDYALYQLQNGTLTLTAHEPGNPDVPASFDAPETRRFVFKGK